MKKINALIKYLTQSFFIEGVAGAFSSLALYWNTYGGIKSLLSSLYFYLALIIAALLTRYGDPCWNWSADTKQIIACTVGFSFAGYSLMLGMAGDKFIKIIKGKYEDGKPSPLMEVAGAFTHFFIVQCITLLFAIFTSALSVVFHTYFRFVGIFLLCYSILALIATALAALNFVSWYNDYSADE